MPEQGNVELQQEAGVAQEISGAQLFSHLLGVDTIKGGPLEFPRNLDLGMFESYMRELHQQRETTTQNLAPGNDALGIKPINLEGEAEVAETIFYNVKADSLSATNKVRGGLSSVRSSFIDAFGVDRIPLVEMHTHPVESLPSISDFQFMLLGNPEARIRGIRAIAVLCPQTQILALATDHTPILNPGQVGELMTQWDEPNKRYEGREGTYLRTLENRLERAHKAWLEAFEGIQERIRRKFEQDMKRIAHGLEPEEDEEPEGSSHKTIDKAIRVQAKAFGKYKDYVYKTFNRIQLQFAREMGIKLYISTDFKNFVALPDQLPPS